MTAHLAEELQDFLDGRLADAQRERVQIHLESCAACRHRLETLRGVKQAVARGATRHEAPTALTAAIRNALDAEDRRTAGSALRRSRARRWAGGLGLAAAAALAAVMLWPLRPAALPAVVAEEFAALRSGQLTLELRTSQPQELERYFAARSVGFDARVFDLAAMNVHVVGGRVQELRGRPSALFVYRGAGGEQLLCQMYEGRVEDLPPAEERFEHNGIAFRVYHLAGLTAVFWPEGGIMCVLISDLPPEDVIRLAKAKAVRV